MLEHWQLWAVFPFLLACALGPWVKAKDTESAPLVPQLPFVILAFGGFVGIPWLLWREYREGGFRHAALMFVAAFGGAIVFGLIVGLAIVFIARRLAAFSQTSVDGHIRFLRTCMQVVSVVLAPWTAYYIYAGTR